jgi:outer membrane protein OmpA-like peptidoglycan-associated protein
MSIDWTSETAPHPAAARDGAAAARGRLSRELYDFVGRAVGPDFVPRLARFVDEDEARSEAAFSLLFSAAVRRIARAAQSREATEWLFAHVHGQEVAVDVSEILTGLLGDPVQRDLPAAADSKAHALFGGKAGSLVLSVGTATGMAFDSVWKLACVVTPFAYAAVADHCTRNDLDAAGLRSVLESARNGSRRSHRRRVGPTLRESGSRAVEAAFDGGVRALKHTRAALGEARTRVPEMRSARFALPAVAVVVALAAGAAFLAFDSEHPQIPTVNAQSAAEVASVALPDGQSLQVRREGPVDRMVAFLSQEATGEQVFMLDGIRFDGQSATLRSASHAQLEQVAMVLAAFPAARVDIQAPAEHLGDAEEERGLAEQRALAVRAALGAFGVRPSRMTHAAGLRADSGTGAGSLTFSDGLIALRVTNG